MDTALICQNGVVSDAVGPHPQYDVFADEFLDHARDNLYNAAGFTPGGILENRVLAGKLVNREADLRIDRALASES